MEKDLTKMLEELCIKSYLSVESIKCKTENDEKILKFDITTEEPQILIGRHGETLFSLQQVFRVMAETKYKDEQVPHIIIDVDGYRDSQVEGAYKMVDQSIQKMNALGKQKISLPPMPSYKRRAVHFYVIENFPDYETESIGFGTERKVVISKKQV